MAITFLEERKIQKYLILILGIILLVVALVIWRGFFVEEKPVLPEEIVKPAKKVEINFDILESSILKGLQPFEEIEPIGEEVEIGRENPFRPYSSPSESE
jgi:hypothetical protein